ncbi:MAG: cation:dicarboxylase symporter family transporter, partial [Gemmatimonadetes bacterium]|nr:cation:dicarboxylase symporter family transporter [Gemmatimonadota bacterium]
MAIAVQRKPIHHHLYVQVVTGIILGVIVGHFWPSVGVALRPLGDGFIKLIRMMIAPIIFGTVVVGIAKIGDVKNVGRIGIRALLYFEVVSTFALILGLIVVNVWKPGVGMNADPSTLNADA